LLNLLYLSILVIASPWLLWRRWRHGKRLGGCWQKVTGSLPHFDTTTPRIWLHAVSVGEVLLLKPILAALRAQYPQWHCVLSVTTVTGREVAEEAYPDLDVIWFPFDFTWAVRRALRRVLPRLIVLAELELWPNFIGAALEMNIPIVVINGRLGERSFRGYRRLRRFIRPTLERISLFAVQQEEYAQRLVRLGMPRDRIRVTGSVKFDSIQADRCLPRITALRAQLELDGNEEDRPLVWVVGSTQAPEEAWALDIYRQMKPHFPQLRLILVPRHQERFEGVADLLRQRGIAFLRKSRLPGNRDSFRECFLEDPVLLVDTLGELRYVWGLAHVAFVGGSFSDRGGQNMIEPAAYGAAVTFGPNTWNFKHVVDALLLKEAAIQVHSKAEWAAVTRQLLADASRRMDLGERASALVRSQQGATARTIDCLRPYLNEVITLRLAG
jgi:3-deoxy-D-manno-octulosonic-acid transferase